MSTSSPPCSTCTNCRFKAIRLPGLQRAFIFYVCTIGMKQPEYSCLKYRSK